MNNTKELKKIYCIEEFTFYGKVLCTSCGSDFDLAHCSNPYGLDDTLCKKCISEIPTYEDVLKSKILTYEMNNPDINDDTSYMSDNERREAYLEALNNMDRMELEDLIEEYEIEVAQ